MKRIATIQDISCLGKCSLTVALPVISAMGVEACIVPTAVLSTHTMFQNYTFRDLTDDLIPIADHWEKENFHFNAIYSGYLGSERQIQIVKDYFHRFKKGKTLTVVDPAMGDNGKLYPGFDPEFAKKMGTLCGEADLILPNLTEATFMLGEPYVESGYDEDYIKGLLQRLTALGAKTAVLTGVSFAPGRIGAMGYTAASGEYFAYFNEKVDASFHGTGDIFASAVVGALMNDFSLEQSLKIAADYTANCIRITAADPNGIRYGVYFETLLPELIQSLGR